MTAPLGISRQAPLPGWKHALNAAQFRSGDVFGWTENGALWSGIVREVGPFTVRVDDILPGRIVR